MARELQESLSAEGKIELLKVLEEQGKEKWLNRWKSHMAFPEHINPVSKNKADQEKVLRYLLFRVLINQQARSEVVRKMTVAISSEFADALLFEPSLIPELELFEIFRNIAGRKGSLLYKVGSLGGIKPLSLFAYRFKAFEGFIKWLNSEHYSFYELVITQLRDRKPIDLFNFLNAHPILEAGWVGNDPKACRMYINWIVFLFYKVWGQESLDMRDTLMIVDGHVGKVFCRSGLLDKVLYENNKPYIIQASNMRPWIEEIVVQSDHVPFYVDNGAFFLFEDGYCSDLDPQCGNCPIYRNCKKYLKWTAYQKWIG